jgi:hypothetical protein
MINHIKDNVSGRKKLIFWVFILKDICANFNSYSLHVFVLFMLYTLFCSSVLFSFLPQFFFIHVFFRFCSLYCLLSPYCSVCCILHNALYLNCCLISGLSTLSPAPLFLFSAFVLFCLRFVYCFICVCSVMIPVSLLFSHIFCCFRSPYCSLIFSVVSGLPIVLSYFLLCIRSPYCASHLPCSVSGLPIVLIIFPVLFPVSILFSSSALFCFRSPHFQGFIIILWMLSSSVPWQNWYHWSWPSPAGEWWRRLASRTGFVWWPPCAKLEWYTHETSGFKTLEWLQIFSWNFCSCFKPSRC